MQSKLLALSVSLLTFLTPAVCFAQRTGPARIALLTSKDVEAARNVQDLALAKLSTLTPGGKEGELVLLERATVERLLQEQKLSLSGLIDANTAVKAGKILAVDLLAVIDHSSLTKQNLGVIIFDATTGVRLEDVGYPSPGADQQVRETAAAVQRAVQKWRAGTKNLKTVCFMPVRNADLPRQKDGLCATLSAMLERQLVQHPAIVTLERKRLDGVSREKMLSEEAATRELLASVLLVEMEVSRPQKGDGLRATVTIRDSAGKVLHKIAHEVADPNGADLLAPLARRIEEVLRTTQVQTTGELNREARRFLSEAALLWKHRHYEQALQAAEAAYALKANDDSRLLLAQYLMEYARELIKPGVLAAGNFNHTPFDATPEKVRTALGLVRRGYQLIDIAKNPSMSKADDGGFWSLAENSNCFHANTAFLGELRRMRVQPADSEIDQDLRALREDSLRRHVDRLKELARRVGPKGTPRFTKALHDHYGEQLGYFAPDSSAAMAAVQESVRLWLDLSRQLGADVFPAEVALSFGERGLRHLYYPGVPEKDYTRADRESSLPLFETLEQHPYPVVRLYASHWRDKQLLKLKRITAAEMDEREQKVIAEAKGWIDKPPFKNPAVHQIALYEFLDWLLFHSPQRNDPKDNSCAEKYFALIEFMLQRKHVVAAPWIHASHETARQVEHHPRSLDLMRRMQAVYDAPTHALFSDPHKHVKLNLEQARFVLLKRSPALDKAKSPLPWDKATAIVELQNIPRAHTLMAPVRHASNVYLFAGCVEPKSKQPYLQLVRANLNGGAPELLGTALVTVKDLVARDPATPFVLSPRFVTECVIHRERLYAGTVNDGIYVFPLSGGKGVRIGEKEGLPSPKVVSLTALEGKLFATLTDGYIVVYDPDTQSTDVIASSRRSEAQSPFDNSKPFSASMLRADAERHRVLFRVWHHTANHPNTGLWEYSLKKREFKKLLAIPHYYKATPVQHGTFALVWKSWTVGQRDGKSFWQEHESIGQFDLKTDKFTLLAGRPLEAMPDQKAVGIPANFAGAFYVLPGGEASQLYHGGQVWLSSPFSRTPVKGGKQEVFPHVRAKEWTVAYSECFEAISRTELLVGDWRGVYVITLKQ